MPPSRGTRMRTRSALEEPQDLPIPVESGSSDSDCVIVEGVYLSTKEKLRNLLDLAERKCSDMEHMMKAKEDEFNSIIMELRKELVDMQIEKTMRIQELKDVLVEVEHIESTCSSQREQITRLQEQLAFAEQKLQMSMPTSEYEEQKAVIIELKNRLIDGDKLRRELHNSIVELKGNIRVFCRVRPLLSDDGVENNDVVISFPKAMETLGRGIDLTHNGQKHSFTYDKVFMPNDTQQDVFVEISQLVQSALDGYNVCIFAYGQTGSGKTHTMMGKPEPPDQNGLIPRSLEQVFVSREILEAQGWKFKIQVSMLEIYNETIRDLLAGSQPAATKTGVSNLTVLDVHSSKEVSSLLERATQRRSVGKTQMNEESSRSNFVFTLRIEGINESADQQVQGVLNLIDLAGSQRLSKSGATGDRLKETQAIHKTLSALGDVIYAIAKKKDHIPFRNSKLTYFLQPYLGGDSKTLMLVNVSPDPSSVGESLCSLQFAARVNSCEIGVPRRQTNIR